MQSVILVFLDGVGLGKADNNFNPFCNGDFYFAKKLFGKSPSLENPFLYNNEGMFVFPSNANLSTEGIPQSGTGQTTILCGKNAAQIIGKHFGPFPHSRLLTLLKNQNIYSDLKNSGLSSNFVNAYPPKFFEYLRKGHKRTAATTKAAMFANLKLNGIEELKKGEAISHEIDNSRWKSKLDLPVDIIAPEKAAENLMRIGDNYNFVFYEYYLTDHWGHGREKAYYNYGIEILNKFLLALVNKIKPNQTLIICSDHGNYEDLSVKSHTRNPVFTFSAGYASKQLAGEIKSIADIKKSILNIFLSSVKN